MSKPTRDQSPQWARDLSSGATQGPQFFASARVISLERLTAHVKQTRPAEKCEPPPAYTSPSPWNVRALPNEFASCFVEGHAQRGRFVLIVDGSPDSQTRATPPEPQVDEKLGVSWVHRCFGKIAANQSAGAEIDNHAFAVDHRSARRKAVLFTHLRIRWRAQAR